MFIGWKVNFLDENFLFFDYFFVFPFSLLMRKLRWNRNKYLTFMQYEPFTNLADHTQGVVTFSTGLNF